MKNFTPYLFICFLFTTSSCTITINDKEKSSTSNDGSAFMYDEREVTVNGVFPVKNNEIIAGEYIVMNFKGVQNALEKDGYHHVGISIKIMNTAGEVIEESDDLYANMELQSADYNIYYAYYGVPTKLADGEQLTFELTLFDKFGGIKYDFNDTYTVRHKASPFTENVVIETNLDLPNIGIQVFETCFQQKKSPILLESPEKLETYFKGIKGFKDINGIVFFEYTISIFDETGKEISSTTNTFDGDVTGMEYYPLTAFYDFKQLSSGKYKWHVQFKDVSSDKFVKAIIDVVI
jgi:hypothetical protein